MGGVDAALSPDGAFCLAAAVVWDIERAAVLEAQRARRRVTFPYVPGLLSFREAPAALAALRKVRHALDAILCDAHGYAHPRRFGLACHIGLLAGVPTVGCAKTRLIGEFREPHWRRGSVADLRAGESVVGRVVRTRDRVRPVFVSVGHLVDLDTACDLVLRCAVGSRLPEPTRRADRLVAEWRRGGLRDG